jgi:heme a synthase
MDADVSSPDARRFRLLSWASLIFTIGVILWGAYVRATGSGAGCGSHWPLCNGEVVPRIGSEKTAIEVGHRGSVLIGDLMVLAQYLWSRRLFAADHGVRRAMSWAGLFMIVENLIGGGIVLLKYVEMDQSVGRAVWMGIHLISTFLLVASQWLVAWRAGGGRSLDFAGRRVVALLGGAALAGVLATSATGAIAALGDTLFPPKTLGGALREDLSPTAHWLVQLRTIHPFFAVGAAFVVLAVRQGIESARKNPRVSSAGTLVRVTIVGQVGLGFLNMTALAPIGLQLSHLFVAQLVWLALLSFVVTAVESDAVEAEIDASQETEALAAVGGDLALDAPAAADEQKPAEALAQLPGLGVAEDDRIAEAKAEP